MDRLLEAEAVARARSSLLPFTNYTFPKYEADPAHALVAGALDQVVAGEIRRLMIFAPPQHGKSELVSVRLPAYWLGKRPDDPIILCSYAADLAHSKARQAREIVESTEYQAVFPGKTTRRDSRAAHDWALAKPYRGYMLAAGVGGPITGRGAMLGIIDDPVENWEEAQSEVIRKKHWQWYRSTFRTRIWEQGAIVLVMTRWHEEDLAGMLLKEQAGEWVVIRLPALAETQVERDANNEYLGLPTGERDPLGRRPGQPLCPRRYSKKALLQLQKDVGSVVWSGEYGGVPRAAEGNRFKRAWFEIVDKSPALALRARYWDKAGTEDGGKYTAGVLMAKSRGTYYVEHVVRGQWSALERETVIRQTAGADAAKCQGRVEQWIEQEPGSGGLESAQATIRTLAGFRVYAERVTGEKGVRAEPYAAQAEAGNVKLVRGPWNRDYIEELAAFPNSAYTDQVDGSSGAFNKLATARGELPEVESGIAAS